MSQLVWRGGRRTLPLPIILPRPTVPFYFSPQCQSYVSRFCQLACLFIVPTHTFCHFTIPHTYYSSLFSLFCFHQCALLSFFPLPFLLFFTFAAHEINTKYIGIVQINAPPPVSFSVESFLTWAWRGWPGVELYPFLVFPFPLLPVYKSCK
ncbi:hypothetical protein BOTBODRAFT_600406 [Botryobasidium botryosum FD-172 SS1]|uniref:Uncharacterized protein n=1 Tax=Botryobasidium botryosum (strain FD-172 SS1) TaxID=930990 RepID=A0A067MR75_BOTB1|nr:hypothetical protein BOTBODRAFT_600406 [Botryobasidium botryosum FD-172 SS1]